MIWNSFAEFADMGGYGLYVWAAYVMTGAALGWEALMLLQGRRRALEDLRDPIHPADAFDPAIGIGAVKPDARGARPHP